MTHVPGSEVVNFLAYLFTEEDCNFCQAICQMTDPKFWSVMMLYATSQWSDVRYNFHCMVLDVYVSLQGMVMYRCY